MEQILHQLIDRLSHYLQGLLHPTGCKISSLVLSLGQLGVISTSRPGGSLIARAWRGCSIGNPRRFSAKDNGVGTVEDLGQTAPRGELYLTGEILQDERGRSFHELLHVLKKLSHDIGCGGFRLPCHWSCFMRALPTVLHYLRVETTDEDVKTTSVRAFSGCSDSQMKPVTHHHLQNAMRCLLQWTKLGFCGATGAEEWAKGMSDVETAGIVETAGSVSWLGCCGRDTKRTCQPWGTQKGRAKKPLLTPLGRTTRRSSWRRAIWARFTPSSWCQHQIQRELVSSTAGPKECDMMVIEVDGLTAPCSVHLQITIQRGSKSSSTTTTMWPGWGPTETKVHHTICRQRHRQVPFRGHVFCNRN